MPIQNITDNEKNLIDQLHDYLFNRGYVTKSGRRAGLLDYTRISRELGIDRGLLERKFNKENRFTVPDLENLSKTFNISFLIADTGHTIVEATQKELEFAEKLIGQSRRVSKTGDNVVFLQPSPPRHFHLPELKKRLTYLKELIELNDKDLSRELITHGDPSWQEMPAEKKSELLRKYVQDQIEVLEKSIREGKKREPGTKPEK